MLVLFLFLIFTCQYLLLWLMAGQTLFKVPGCSQLTLSLPLSTTMADGRPNFVQGTGLQPNSTEFYELYGNWSQTVTESLQAVRDAGGYTWSNVNCELDPPYGKPCDVSKKGNCSAANDAYVGPNGVYPCGYVACTCVQTELLLCISGSFFFRVCWPPPPLIDNMGSSL